MDFEKCILILKQAIQKLNINMYHLQGEANTKSVLDLLTQIDDEIGKTPKPRTNFDRITESVESLAEFLYKLAEECQHHNCLWCDLRDCNCCDIDCIKEWLQKEIEE